MWMGVGNGRGQGVQRRRGRKETDGDCVGGSAPRNSGEESRRREPSQPGDQGRLPEGGARKSRQRAGEVKGRTTVGR